MDFWEKNHTASWHQINKYHVDAPLFAALAKRRKHTMPGEICHYNEIFHEPTIVASQKVEVR